MGVIKTVFYGGSDCKFAGGEYALHRLRKDMRAGVAVNLPAFLVLEGENFQAVVAVQNVAQLADNAVHLCSQRGARQTFGNFRRRFLNGHRRVVFKA